MEEAGICNDSVNDTDEYDDNELHWMGLLQTVPCVIYTTNNEVDHNFWVVCIMKICHYAQCGEDNRARVCHHWGYPV